MNTEPLFKVGDIVKYKNPLPDEDPSLRFTVLEYNPPTEDQPAELRIEAICSMAIRPQYDATADEVELA